MKPVLIALVLVALGIKCGVAEPTLPTLPKNAYDKIPLVIKALEVDWPSMPMPSFIPSMIEQESCISVTHSKCWSSTVELKTSREYGFGLGQITIAYNSNGSVRFNVFEELKAVNPSLRDWKWSDRYNALYQIRAIVLKNRLNWNKITFPTRNLWEKLAFLAAYYNSGSPVKDMALCRSHADCDPTSWFNRKGKKGVEAYSYKSKTVKKGYGKSFFDISREYPINVLISRRPKYIPYVEKS
jgi:hypothetical protein